jgi:transcriptional antiterminator RfaH
MAWTASVERGFRCYLPRFHSRQKAHRGGTRVVMRVLFPGYLFVGCGRDTPSWRDLYTTPGIIEVVGGHCERLWPSLVRHEFLLELAGHEDERVGRTRVRWPFVVGDMVRVMEGPFSGYYARLLTLDPIGRISLLSDVLGGAPINGMRASQVEPLGAHPSASSA